MDTEVLAGLMKTSEAGKHFLGPRKHVAHIVKNRKTDIFQKVRHGNVWKAYLQIVKEYSAATDGKSSERGERSCLVQPESAMGVASAAEKTLRERDKSVMGWHSFRRIQQNSVSERVFNSDAGGSGE